MSSQLQLLNSDLTGGSLLKLTPDLFSLFRFGNGKHMRTVMRGSRKTYCLSQEVLLYLCHESPKLREKKNKIMNSSHTGGGEFIQKGECGGAQVPTTKVGLTQNEGLVSCPSTATHLETLCHDRTHLVDGHFLW